MKEATDYFYLHPTTIAENIVPGEGGVWIAREHADMRFAESDDIDWAAIEENSFWYEHRNRCFAAVMQSYSPSGTLVEVGAGNGSVSLALQHAGYPVIAIEPTIRSAWCAKRRGVSTVICASLEDGGFRAASLPSVGMFDVLEHIEADCEYLHLVRRLMLPNGRFYCAVPAWTALWSSEDDAAQHFRRYSLGELERRIVKAGFQIEYSTYYFGALLVPIFLLRALPSRLGIRKRRTAAMTSCEHSLRPGIVSSALRILLDREVRTLSSSGRCNLGASCLVVARAT